MVVCLHLEQKNTYISYLAVDSELILNPSDSDLFDNQLANSTPTRLATQSSRPSSFVHVPRHRIIHYSQSSSSGPSPTPPNSPKGRDRRCQPSGERHFSRRRVLDRPCRRCSTHSRPTANLQHSHPVSLHQTGQSHGSSAPSRKKKKSHSIVQTTNLGFFSSSWPPLPPPL